MKIIFKLIITAGVALLLTKFLSGVQINSVATALVFSLVLGVLNLIVKPIFQVFGFPLTILTLGLFSLVINALVVLIADYFVDGMNINGFWWALIFSVGLSVITSLINGVFGLDEE